MHPNVDRLKNNLKDRERNKVIKEVLELIDKRVDELEAVKISKFDYEPKVLHACLNEFDYLKQKISELGE